MASFDYDVVIIGSGSGKRRCAPRRGERLPVGVMEAGKRWKDEDIPRTIWDLPGFLWLPAAGLYGIQRSSTWTSARPLAQASAAARMLRRHALCPSEAVLRRAGMGGHHRLGRRIAPCIDQARGCSASFATRTCLPTSIGNQQVAMDMGRGETFNKAPVGVYFGSPGVEADDPYFGGVGRVAPDASPAATAVGCGRNAKNKLTTNTCTWRKARRRGP